MIGRPPRSTLFPYTTFFFFNDTATTEIYTLSLHDALPRSEERRVGKSVDLDRKSTRLNSSHGSISYAVFCLKKKTKQTPAPRSRRHARRTRDRGRGNRSPPRDRRAAAELFFFFNDTATTEIYTLSLHDALPI